MKHAPARPVSAARISPGPAESAGSFAARCLAFANGRQDQVRGRFGALEFTANPGDLIGRVLEPFYNSARW